MKAVACFLLAGLVGAVVPNLAHAEVVVLSVESEDVPVPGDGGRILAHLRAFTVSVANLNPTEAARYSVRCTLHGGRLSSRGNIGTATLELGPGAKDRVPLANGFALAAERAECYIVDQQ